MGAFLQTALFPGCAESIAREAVETAAKDPAFQIDPKTCRYAQSYEGTQVLMEGDCLGFAALADYSKRHRAWRDLERLMELDPANRALYEAESRRWRELERSRERDMTQYHQTVMREFAERKRKEEEREARRLQLILEKRRKKKR